MTNDKANPGGCNPDDVVCEMEVLRHLRGLEQQLGHEVFLEKYPEAVSLRDKLPGAITRQEETVQEAVDGCVKGDTIVDQLESRAEVQAQALEEIIEREDLEAEGEDE